MPTSRAGGSLAGTSRPALLDAIEAVRIVQARPRAARTLAVSALERARTSGDLEAQSVAKRALGLVAKEQPDLRTAQRHLAEAVRLAERARAPTRGAEARMSLALVLANQGKVSAALEELRVAEGILTGEDNARLRVQRALILQHQDRIEEALADYRKALPVLRKCGDQLWETRALCNRGVLHTNRGNIAAGEHDLLGALELCNRMDFDLGAGFVQQNLGYLCGRRGDVVAALEWYEKAGEAYRHAGIDRAELLFDVGELLLSARLVAEAREAAEQAVEELGRNRMALRLAEARLMLSQAALLDGDLTTARDAAEKARRAFARQHRPGWAALAQYAWLRTAWAAGDRSPATLSAALRTANALRDAGWAVSTLDARILAARIALELNRVDVASRELAAAGRAREKGPAELRCRAWHARALLLLARGDRKRAESSLVAGMDVVDAHRAALGATELRAHYSAHGTDLALSGLRMALEDRDAERVFEWAERWRAGATRVRPVRPPEDAALASHLTELRRVVHARAAAALDGRETASLLRQQAELEEAVRHRARRVSGGAPDDCAAGPSARTVAGVLGGRALVEITELDGRLYAVVVTTEAIRLRELGAAAEADHELQSLQFALRRLARSHAGQGATAAAITAVTHAAKRLDSLILEPLAVDIADRPLVIAPTGTLHAMPWSLLPSCRARPVAVTPCAALWHAAITVESGAPSAGRVVLVAGPDLPHAAEEVRRLGRRYPDADRLTGRKARTGPVLAALDGASLAHVAAHGTFRADNPLFSAISLADGPVTVYDLESLPVPPQLLVLSACESGLSAVRPGDELMGLAASVLGLGTRTLVASVIAVPDDHTAHLMLAFHRHLKAGARPAEALCRAQASVDASDPRSIAAAAGFVCFGAG